MPWGPSSHLCPPLARKSIGVSCRSSGSTPRLCIASTQSATPRSLHSCPIASRSLRNPLEYSTLLSASMRVRGFIASRKSSIEIRLARLATFRTVTPRWARFIHGYWFDGYSSFASTTLSPSRQGNPSATMPSPSLVFLRSAISNGSQFTSLASERRVSSVRSTQPLTAVEPFAFMSEACWMSD